MDFSSKDESDFEKIRKENMETQRRGVQKTFPCLTLESKWKETTLCNTNVWNSSQSKKESTQHCKHIDSKNVFEKVMQKGKRSEPGHIQRW